jgi:competence protein ComEC
MSKIPKRFELVLRQRTPFLGLLSSAILGILVADSHLDLWPVLAAAAFGASLFLLRFPSTLAACFLTLLMFAFWHGYQVSTDEGFLRSTTVTDQERTVTLLVLTEPTTDMYRLTQRFTALVKSMDGQPASFPVAAECAGGPYKYGDEIPALGKFSSPPFPLNPGEFDYATFLRRQNIYLEFRSSHGKPPDSAIHNRGNPIIAAALVLRHRMADSLKKGLEEDPEVAESVQAMVLGARGETSPDLKKLFQETGTIHLFAASGLQVALFGGLALFSVRYLRLRRRFAALFVLPVVFWYCAATGFHPATVRATVMATLLAIGVSLERPAVALNLLAASGLIILVHDTQQLFQIGFQLSFVAVFGIITLVDRGAHLLSRPFELDPFFPKRLLKPWQRLYYRYLLRFCESLSLTIVCWLATAPILILWENHFSLVSLAANLVVVPPASIVMILGLGSALVMPIFPALALYLNNTCWLLTKMILIVLHGAASIPDHSINIASPAAITTDGMAVLAEGLSHVCFLRSAGHNLLLNTGLPSLWERVTLPYLRYQGVNSLQYVLATESGRRQSGGPPLRHWEIPVEQFVEANSIPGTSGPDAAQPSPVLRSPFKWVSISDPQSHPQEQSAILQSRIGRFEILVITDLTDFSLLRLPAHHADIVYCAHSRTRRFPRDALIRTLSPQLIILSGTKPERTAGFASLTQGQEPTWLFLKETGAVTAFVQGEELLITPFHGPQLRLRSLSR